MELLLTCQHCRQQNVVSVDKGETGEPQCLRCSNTLMNYSAFAGYIYVLSNPKMKGLLKIGLSTRAVQERVAELSSATGVPAPFELEAYFLSTEPEDHERQIHTILAEYRVSGKEFFEVPVNEALNVAESVCRRPPAYLNPRNAEANPTLSHRSYAGHEPGSLSTRERIKKAWQRRPW